MDEQPGLGDWTPALDVAEGKEAITVTAELPGVDGVVTITLPKTPGAKGTTIPIKAA